MAKKAQRIERKTTWTVQDIADGFGLSAYHVRCMLRDMNMKTKKEGSNIVLNRQQFERLRNRYVGLKKPVAQQTMDRLRNISNL